MVWPGRRRGTQVYWIAGAVPPAGRIHGALMEILLKAIQLRKNGEVSKQTVNRLAITVLRHAWVSCTKDAGEGASLAGC
jgi:hypothetical protein